MDLIEFFNSSEGIRFMVGLTTGLLALVLCLFALQFLAWFIGSTFKNLPHHVTKFFAERRERSRLAKAQYDWDRRVAAVRARLHERGIKPELLVCVQNQNGNRGIEETRLIAILTGCKCGIVPIVNDETWARLASAKVTPNDVMSNLRYVVWAKVIQGGKDIKVDFRIIGGRLGSSTPVILAAEVLEGSEKHMEDQVILALYRAIEA